jgi:hypothetical protein
MTPEKIERNFEAAGFFIAPSLTKLVMALCKDAAREEREHCAKMAAENKRLCEALEEIGNMVEEYYQPAIIAAQIARDALRKGE